MDYDYLADLLYPDVKISEEDLEARFPQRDLRRSVWKPTSPCQSGCKACLRTAAPSRRASPAAGLLPPSPNNRSAPRPETGTPFQCRSCEYLLALAVIFDMTEVTQPLINDLLAVSLYDPDHTVKDPLRDF